MQFRTVTKAALLMTTVALAACQDDSVTAPDRQAAINTADASAPRNVQIRKEARAPRGVQAASLLADPVPASVIVSHNCLEWVWASPCALNGCTSGILVGKDGFRFATAQEWAARPPESAFAGKCATPWFDQTFDHCDPSNLDDEYGSVAAGGTGAVANGGVMEWYFETLLVRVAVPTDNTAPIITPTVTGTLGANGWYTSNVTVSFSVVDAESTISAQNGCATSTVTADAASVSFTCSATSAGGSASETVTIKRDATIPVVTYTGGAASYTVDQNVAITCAATDALSGVASTTCANITGAAYTLGLGARTYSATATDAAGNQGGGSVSFTVVATHASVCELTKRFVTKNGVATSLCAKLDAAAASAARGNTNAAHNQLDAYINEVNAQSGKSVSATDAAVLAALAAALK